MKSFIHNKSCVKNDILTYMLSLTFIIGFNALICICIRSFLHIYVLNSDVFFKSISQIKLSFDRVSDVLIVKLKNYKNDRKD